MLFALAFLTGGSWFSFSSVVRSKSPFTPGSLEEKARKAESGNEDDVRDLADEVFYRYGQMMPAEVANGIKERVVRAEMEYKKSRKGGVRESHVVHAVNHLVEKFNAPDFAKTDLRQMKILRARLKSGTPSFFAPDAKEKKGLRKKLGEPMNPEVSPLEATGLMLVMLTQKALNDDFQQTPKEFAVKSSRKPSWLEADRGGPTLALNDPRNIEKSRAVFNAAARGVTHLSVAEAISLAGDTLDKLGIKK
jgi:hypothetical protein